MIHIYLIPYDLCLIIYIFDVWQRRAPVNISLATARPFWLTHSDDDLEMVMMKKLKITMNVQVIFQWK